MILDGTTVTDKIIARFWDGFVIQGSCWIWTKTRNKKRTGRGYGKVAPGIWAHRLSWVLHNGPIPEGKEVCHNCPGGDNSACVNPAHLWLGTHRENMQDALRKGAFQEAHRVVRQKAHVRMLNAAATRYRQSLDEDPIDFHDLL